MKRGVIVLVMCAAAAVARGDVIELHNGKRIECTIVLEDGKKVFFKENAETRAIDLKDISGIIRNHNKPLKTPDEVKTEPVPVEATEPSPATNPKPVPAPESPAPEPAPAAKEPELAPPAVEEPKEDPVPEETQPEREIVRTTDETLDSLFTSLKETCEKLNASTTEEERTFYRMRAIILEKHINSCGYAAGRIALDEMNNMPVSTWKRQQLYIGFLAEIVAGCRDRDIVPYFWEEWMPPNLKRVQSTASGEFGLSIVKRIVADLKASQDNTYRSVKYQLETYAFRGTERYRVKKVAMGMPK